MWILIKAERLEAKILVNLEQVERVVVSGLRFLLQGKGSQTIFYVRNKEEAEATLGRLLSVLETEGKLGLVVETEGEVG